MPEWLLNEIDLQRPPAPFIMQIVQIANAEVDPARIEVGAGQEDSSRAWIIRSNPCYLVAATVLAQANSSGARMGGVSGQKPEDIECGTHGTLLVGSTGDWEREFALVLWQI